MVKRKAREPRAGKSQPLGLTSVSRNRDILHIVSGQMVGGMLGTSGVPSNKNILIWWDSLAVGPTPQTSSLEEMSQIRGRFYTEPSPLNLLFSGEQRDIPKSLVQRDRLLRRCSEWREVALWFGPWAMEQLSLMQILAAMAEQDIGKTKLSLVECPELAMGCYNPTQLGGFFPARAAIPWRRVELAKRAWRLYCGADPVSPFRFAKRRLASASALAAALISQMREYPSIQNGLSALEDALLRNLEHRITVVEAVVRVLVAQQEGLVGDLMLFEAMWRFLCCPVPLVEASTGSLRDVVSWQAFCRLPVQLTTTGRAVLAGRADHITLNGIDRWIGGVHLKGNSVRWRWDSELGILRRPEPSNRQRAEDGS
jgi:hypothetical protein